MIDKKAKTKLEFNPQVTLLAKIFILERMKFGEALKLFPKRNGTGKRHMRKVNVTGKV